MFPRSAEDIGRCWPLHGETLRPGAAWLENDAGQPIRPYEAELDGLQPNVYTLERCREEQGACVPDGDTVLTYVVPTQIEPLIPGSNINDDDRIHLVFSCVHYESVASCKAAIIRALTLDGPERIALPKGSTSDQYESVPAALLDHGWFAMEPARSNRHKFDLWVFKEQHVASSSGRHLYTWPIDMMRQNSGARFLGFPAHDFVFVQASAWPVSENGVDGFVNANQPTQRTPGEPWPEEYEMFDVPVLDWFIPLSRVGPGPLARDTLSLGSATVYVPEGARSSVASAFYYGRNSVLAHELAHAVYGLPDEYYNEERNRVRVMPQDANEEDYAFASEAYPSLARQENVDAWWGDLMGKVDPFYYEWIANLEAHGISTEGLSEDIFRVSAEPYTYAVTEEGSRRLLLSSATRTSLMRESLYPVLGAANRRRAEQVLSLYGRDGRAQ